MSDKPVNLINSNKFAAYSIGSMQMFSFEIDDSASGSKQSSEPIVDNHDFVLAVSNKQILIFYKTSKGLYPRISGIAKNIEFDKDGFLFKVKGVSGDFGFIDEDFVIEWPKKGLFSSMNFNIKQKVTLSVQGKKEYFEPEVSQQWFLNDCLFLGEITIAPKP